MAGLLRTEPPIAGDDARALLDSVWRVAWDLTEQAATEACTTNDASVRAMADMRATHYALALRWHPSCFGSLS